MAELIPPSIQQLKSASSGERKIYQLLEQVFQNENAIIWYEPKALNRYTDFIVWLPQHGLLVIEVKDWSKDRFETLNPETFTGRFYNKNDQRLLPVKNPELQVRRCMLNVMSELKKAAIFLQQQGSYQGNVKFPITSCVIYTEMKQEDADKIGLSLSSISTAHKTIYKDDLKSSLDQSNFKQKLIGAFKDVAFPFKALTYAEEKALRYMIFPEIRVNEFTQDELFAIEPQQIKALDLSQESIAKNIGEGHRILKGVAGSGKTLVLACRAKYLKTIYPDYKILVVCYNNSLCNHLKHMFGEDFNQKIDVLNFHAVVKNITQKSLAFLANESQNDYNVRVGNILHDYLNTQPLAENEKYDAILIDEGQDFAQEWIQGLVKLVKEDTNNILFCYDPAQNIFNRSKPSWRSVGLQVQGKRPVELFKCYRNTKEILDIAREFLNPQLLDRLQNPESDVYDRVLDPDTGECKTGEMPSIYHQNDVKQLADLIARKIRQLLHQGVSAHEIAVLQAKSTEYDGFVDELHGKLQAYCPQLVVDLVFSSTEKKSLNLQKDSIKIMNVESSKGLEFQYVFFVGLDYMPRLGANRDLDSEKKLAYVGMTRAQNKLFILGCENKGFLTEVKEIHQKLNVTVETAVEVHVEGVTEMSIDEDGQEDKQDSMIGQKWTEDEEVRMIDAFMVEKLSIKEIAKRHQRKEGGIRARLLKLRLIE